MKHLFVALGVAGLVLIGASSARAQADGMLMQVNQHGAKLTADFTDANAAGAQNIPALQFFLPAGPAQSWYIRCTVQASQATQVADNFGIQFGTAPTNGAFSGWMQTGATAGAGGTPASGISGTSNTNIVTFTPSGSGVFGGYFDGIVELPATTVGTQVNITVTQGTAADVIVVKRDSGCIWALLQ